MDQFNVEDAFFGALLGAWCSKFSEAGGVWTDVSTLIRLALIFLMFGFFFRVLLSQANLTWKLLFCTLFLVTSFYILANLHGKIGDSRGYQINFFASILLVWASVCVIKILYYRKWLQR